MFRASTAHHQEVRCMYVANGTSKMAVSRPGWSGTAVKLAVAQLVEALCYEPEGRGFDSRWCHRNFSLT
jgi:hypothetical protein